MRKLLPFLLLSTSALAAPPPGTDTNSQLHAWFERQYSVNGALCCSEADGHIISDDDWRATGRSYDVKINDQWWSVPEHALRNLEGGPNPTGNPIVWYTSNADGSPNIYCFAPGYEY